MNIIRWCVTFYQRETTSPRQSGLARRRYGIACWAFQPAKPPILGPSAENTHARPYQFPGAGTDVRSLGVEIFDPRVELPPVQAGCDYLNEQDIVSTIFIRNIKHN